MPYDKYKYNYVFWGLNTFYQEASLIWGLITLSSTVSGEQEISAGNLNILRGIGTPNIHFRENRDNISDTSVLPKVSQKGNDVNVRDGLHHCMVLLKQCLLELSPPVLIFNKLELICLR